MNTQQKQIGLLEILGYSVRFEYILEISEYEDFYYFETPSSIKGKFAPGGTTKCYLYRNTTTGKLNKTSNSRFTIIEEYIGTAYCNKVDTFVPKIGRAIAFKRAYSLFTEFMQEQQK